MRRLQTGNETPPNDRSKWTGGLSDFAMVRPWLGEWRLFDTEKGADFPTPWLTRRQCWSKEMDPVAPVSFYQASKLTNLRHGAIMLGISRTVGYPVPSDPKLDPIDEAPPIRTKHWAVRFAAKYHGVEIPPGSVSPICCDVCP